MLIDADLQDPPELIPKMIQLWQEGNHVVYGVRESRSGESQFKLLTAQAFYRLINQISDVPIPLDTGDFRLMDRRVVDVLKKMPERDRFVRGMVSWVGFKQCPLPYARAERAAGESKYPLRKMVLFAMDGLVSFSIVPLRISMVVGFVTAIDRRLGNLLCLVSALVYRELGTGLDAIVHQHILPGGNDFRMSWHRRRIRWPHLSRDEAPSAVRG